MIYGLYLSASGVMANSYRQDVFANNLANAETTAFKRDVPLFQQRLVEAQANRSKASWSNPLLENLSGGILASPTAVDHQQGEVESTGNPLDVALQGSGMFQVQDAQGQKHLTRDGQFMVDRTGALILANSTGNRVLDQSGAPITIDPAQAVAISRDGIVSQNSAEVARLGLFDVPDRSKLTKSGNNLLDHPDINQLQPSRDTTLRTQFVERANVDAATELTQLMDAQRSLEANANMIRYQDQMLGKLVNEVGKIG